MGWMQFLYFSWGFMFALIAFAVRGSRYDGFTGAGFLAGPTNGSGRRTDEGIRRCRGHLHGSPCLGLGGGFRDFGDLGRFIAPVSLPEMGWRCLSLLAWRAPVVDFKKDPGVIPK
jgi:hypothetical protein